jgi:hypothetical protein
MSRWYVITIRRKHCLRDSFGFCHKMFTMWSCAYWRSKVTEGWGTFRKITRSVKATERDKLELGQCPAPFSNGQIDVCIVWNFLDELLVLISNWTSLCPDTIFDFSLYVSLYIQLFCVELYRCPLGKLWGRTNEVKLKIIKLFKRQDWGIKTESGSKSWKSLQQKDFLPLFCCLLDWVNYNLLVMGKMPQKKDSVFF